MGVTGNSSEQWPGRLSWIRDDEGLYNLQKKDPNACCVSGTHDPTVCA